MQEDSFWIATEKTNTLKESLKVTGGNPHQHPGQINNSPIESAKWVFHSNLSLPDSCHKSHQSPKLPKSICHTLKETSSQTCGLKMCHILHQFTNGAVEQTEKTFLG